MSTRRPFTEEERVTIRQLHEQGWSGRKIARHVGRPIGSICSLKWAEGLAGKNPAPTAAILAKRKARKASQQRDLYWSKMKDRENEAKRRPKSDPRPAWAPWQSRFVKPSDRRAGK